MWNKDEKLHLSTMTAITDWVCVYFLVLARKRNPISKCLSILNDFDWCLLNWTLFGIDGAGAIKEQKMKGKRNWESCRVECLTFF